MIHARDLLTVAEACAGRDEEPWIRTSIDRFYYAAFLASREYCEDHLGYVRMRFGREHGEVPRLLMHRDAHIADQLLFLRSIRNAADYDLNLSKETMIRNLDDGRILSRMIIARLDELTVIPSPR
jgi:hypothetical protein